MAEDSVVPVPAASGKSYWTIPLIRAVVALAAGFTITFVANHSAQLGLLTFGVFALLSGLVMGLGSWRISDRVVRGLFLALGIFGVLAGIAALVVNQAGLGVFLYSVSVWAALTGFCELYCGLRTRRTLPAARDWLASGVFTAILAIVFLLIPPDKVLAVGLFGAYAVILGVYLAIGAFTLKWADSPQHEDSRGKSEA